MRLLIQQQRPQTVQAFIAAQPNQPRNTLDPYDEMVQQRHGEGSVLQQRLVPVRIRPPPGTPAAPAVAPQPAPTNPEQQVPKQRSFLCLP